MLIASLETRSRHIRHISVLLHIIASSCCMHVCIGMCFDGLFDRSGMVCLAQRCPGHVFSGWRLDQPPVYHLRAALPGGLYG